MPRWAIYTLLVVGVLLVLLCCLCICIKCCRGSKKKRQRKEDKINLMEANGKSSTNLVSVCVCVLRLWGVYSFSQSIRCSFRSSRTQLTLTTAPPSRRSGESCCTHWSSMLLNQRYVSNFPPGDIRGTHDTLFMHQCKLCVSLEGGVQFLHACEGEIQS